MRYKLEVTIGWDLEFLNIRSILWIKNSIESGKLFLLVRTGILKISFKLCSACNLKGILFREREI